VANERPSLVQRVGAEALAFLAGRGARPPSTGSVLRDAASELLAHLDGHTRLERHELLSQGFDDFLQLLGGKSSLRTPTSVGIKIPTLPSSSNAGLPYVALCARCDLDKGESLVGFAQYLTIAAIVSTAEADPGSPPIPPVQLYERDVVTAGWRFTDVPPVEWWVTIEPKIPRALPGAFDALYSSFSYQDSGDASMLYAAAGFPVLPLIPGYLGLNAYTPPLLLGMPWYVCRDLHYPMQLNEFLALRYVAPTTVTVRVYALVTQTNPSARDDSPAEPFAGLSALQIACASTSLAPEDAFNQIWPNTAQYRSVGVRLVVEKFGSRPTGG
jgi:hypothetical protein